MVDINLTTHDKIVNIQRLLDEQQANLFKEEYLKLHIFEQAQIFTSLNQNQRARVYRYLTSKEVGDMFNAFEGPAEDVVEYFKEMPTKYVGEVIYEMYTDNAVDILAYAKPQDLAKYLLYVPEKEANEIRQLLHYDNKTAGAIMSTEYMTISSDQTVKNALHAVKKEALDAETIYYIYVISDSNKLEGVLTLRYLLTNEDETCINKIMSTPVMSVSVNDKQEEVAQIIRDYNFLALPVTNDKGELLGIINVDDVIDVIDEESAEDYSHLAGVDVEDKRSKPLQAAFNRLPWTFGLLFLSLLTVIVMYAYRYMIVKETTPVIFIVMVMGVAGNAGTQSLAVAMRRLSDKEDTYTFLRLIMGELIAGVVVGIFAGIIFAIFTGQWLHNYVLGIALGIAMILSILIANLLGCVVPWILDHLRIDFSGIPGTLIAILSNFFSILIYFGIIQVFFKLFKM